MPVLPVLVLRCHPLGLEGLQPLARRAGLEAQAPIESSLGLAVPVRQGHPLGLEAQAPIESSLGLAVPVRQGHPLGLAPCAQGHPLGLEGLPGTD